MLCVVSKEDVRWMRGYKAIEENVLDLCVRHLTSYISLPSTSTGLNA